MTYDQVEPNPNKKSQEDLTFRTFRTGNIPATLAQVSDAVHKIKTAKSNSSWNKSITKAISRRLKWHNDSGRHPASVSKDLQNVILKTKDPILIADGGEFCQWIQAGCSTPRRMINGPSGAIGGGISYAIGASTACPNATVFLVMGDGTAGFYLAEINTAVRWGCKIIVIIGNDFRWNAEVQIQIDNYGPDRVYGCDLEFYRRLCRGSCWTGCKRSYRKRRR